MPDLKTTRNVFLYTIGEIIPRVLSFLLLPILTRYLTRTDYGISSYINTVLTFLYVLTTLSVNSYTLRTYYKVGTLQDQKNLIGNIFIFLCGWGLIMLCIEALLFPVLLRTFSVQVPFYPYFLLGLIINFFDVMSIIPLITYRVSENAKGFVLLSVSRTILQYIFILLLIIQFKLGLLGSFLGRLFACLPFLIVYISVIKRKGHFVFNVGQIKEALKFSLPLLPGALSFLVISMFDRIILERYVTLSDLGIYAVASTLSLTLNIIIQGMYRSFEQKIFREHGSADYFQKIDILYRFYIAALYIPGFLLILFSKEVLLIVTTKLYINAANYVPYLVMAVIISGINTFLGTLLIADNKRKIISYSSFAGAFLSFFINLVFIKYYGVFGACIASILSFIVVSVFYFAKVKILKKYFIQQLLFTSILFIAYFIFQNNLSLIIQLILKIIAAIAFLFLVKISLNLKIPSLSSLRIKKFY